MRLTRIGRLLLALVFAGLAAGCLYAYTVAPYEIVTVTKTTTAAVPDWSGLWFAALFAGIGALVAAFSGDWD